MAPLPANSSKDELPPATAALPQLRRSLLGQRSTLSRSAADMSPSTSPATVIASPHSTTADSNELFRLCQNASTDSAPITKRLALANALDHPVDHHGNTALHLAVMHADVALIALLLRKGADPNVQNAAGKTPLETAKALHESDSSLHSVIARFGCLDKDGTTCRPAPHLLAADLMAAGVSPQKLATLGQTWHLIPLLNGLTTTANDSDGTTPLMRASAAGHTETATRLIARGVDIHARDSNGFTALTWACAGGWSDTVSALLATSQSAAGASASSKTSPLAIASFFGHDSVVAQLVASSHSKPMPAALMLAAWMQHPRVLSKLIAASVAIPQPFSDWLANGRRVRNEWENKHCIVAEPAADSAIIASPSTSISGNLSPSTLADLEVDRVLTVASPETALVAGKQLVKSVPTRTAHQATSELRAELLSAEATPERALKVRGGGVPRYRRGPIFDASELAVDANAIPEPSSVSERLRPAFMKASDLIPRTGTELDVLAGTMASQLIELIRRVHSEDKGRYTSISLAMASQFQTIEARISRISDRRWPAPVLALIRSELTALESDLIPNLTKMTRLASGIWPPPNSDMCMLDSAITALESICRAVRFANTTGMWPLGRIATADLIHSPITAAAVTSGSGGVSFDQYRRANQLQVIDAISQRSPSRSSMGTPSTAATSPLSPPAVVEDHQDDVLFFTQEVDPAVRQFVASVRALRSALNEGRKAVMADLSHSIVAGIDHVADTMLGYSLLQSGPALKDLCMPNGVQLHSHVATRVQEARVAGSAILQRAKIAAGVWPPPNAAPDLIASLHETGAAVRRLVADAKQAIRLVRASMAVDIAKVEEQRRLWMHGEQVRAMFQVWESSAVATAESASPAHAPSGQKVQVAAPSESATKASVVLKNAGHLDDPTDGVVFEHGAVRGGRLVRLVERATHVERFDEPFVRAFLMTHHSFTTSQDLMSVLIKRYELVPPLGIKDEDSFRVWVECKLMPVRTRVLTIFTMWVNNYFSDFLSDDKVLLVKLREFLNIKAARDFPVKVQQINGLVTSQLAVFDNKEPAIDEKQAPKPLVSKAVAKLADGFQHLLDVDSTELARQWTLIEARCFRAVSNKEWINQIWGRVHEASRTKAPTIDSMIGLTNKVTTLVSLMVVREEQEKARHAVIKYWIHVAQACAALNNYNAVTAVVAGLKMGPVRRMEKTWTSFHKKHPKSGEAFTKLAEAVSTSGQYANYRRLMKTVQPPCIPFLGVHITDLTFIEDGNPDYLPDESSGHLINFEKRRKVAAVIEEIAQMQRACKYHLHPVPAIESFLMRLETTSTERELYAMSVKAEPIEDDSDGE